METKEKIKIKKERIKLLVLLLTVLLSYLFFSNWDLFEKFITNLF
jgi:hypothetical protein